MMADHMAVAVRLATRDDMPHLLMLVKQLAHFQGIEEACTATESGLESMLFRLPPLKGPTVFMLETITQIATRKTHLGKSERGDGYGTEVEASTGSVRETNSAPTNCAGGGTQREDGSGVVDSPAGGKDDGLIESQVSDSRAKSSGLLEAGSWSPDIVAADIQLFRSTSDVAYCVRETGVGKDPEGDSALKTHMEEPEIEIFRSTTDVNLLVRDLIADIGPGVVTEGRDVLPVNSHGIFAEFKREVFLDPGIEDSELETFRSPSDQSRVVIGYVNIFPNYSSYLALPGFYLEALYIRMPYRKQGLGSLFLGKVAHEALKLGIGKMEWSVPYTNIGAIEFFEGKGATIKPGMRKCILSGKGLLNCKP